jgi:hypothetical protein
MNTAEYSDLRQGRDLEDRESARFVVPGATVSCKRSGFWHPRNDSASEEKLPVADISKHGLSFLTDSLPRSNRISLLLKYSDHEDVICLKGRVVYCLPRGIGHTYGYRVGVRFDSFSTNTNGNSIEALRILERLEKDHIPVNTQESVRELGGGPSPNSRTDSWGPLNAQCHSDPALSLCS